MVAWVVAVELGVRAWSYLEMEWMFGPEIALVWKEDHDAARVQVEQVRPG